MGRTKKKKEAERLAAEAGRAKFEQAMDSIADLVARPQGQVLATSNKGRPVMALIFDNSLPPGMLAASLERLAMQVMIASEGAEGAAALEQSFAEDQATLDRLRRLKRTQ